MIMGCVKTCYPMYNKKEVILVRVLLGVFILCFILNNVTFAADAKKMIFAENSYLKAEVWLDRQNGDDIILDQGEINVLNKRMQTDKMPDLQQYPPYISGEKLKNLIKEYEIDAALYVNGRLLSDSQIAALKADSNLSGVKAQTEVKYAVVVKRSDLRSLPTDLKAFSTPQDTTFDMWQETAVDPAEPLLVIHYNQKRNFAYVQMRNYRGWLPVEAFALTSRDQWLKFVCPENFAVVTGNLLRMTDGNRKWVLQMGSRIPVEEKVLLMPVRDAAGNLKITKISARYDKALHAGYLSYTNNNLIKQAFAFIGDSYGWGGLRESVDCSSFVADVYRTFGVELPRNADEQEEVSSGNYMDLSYYYEDKDKLKVINKLPIGSALFMPNHVMIYVGTKNNHPYVIHALGSCAEKNAAGEMQRISVMKVVVSELFLKTMRGTSFLEELNSAQSYR